MHIKHLINGKSIWPNLHSNSLVSEKDLSDSDSFMIFKSIIPSRRSQMSNISKAALRLVLVAGILFAAVSIASAACVNGVYPIDHYDLFSAAGGSDEIFVDAPYGCTFVLLSSVEWMTWTGNHLPFMDAHSGGTFQFDVAQNDHGYTRFGDILVWDNSGYTQYIYHSMYVVQISL
jgi:hypothetical protein